MFQSLNCLNEVYDFRDEDDNGNLGACRHEFALQLRTTIIYGQYCPIFFKYRQSTVCLKNFLTPRNIKIKLKLRRLAVTILLTAKANYIPLAWELLLATTWLSSVVGHVRQINSNCLDLK